jgi:hypothetical protein
MRPTKEEVIEFMRKAKLTVADPTYIETWDRRFESPRRVWSFSDYDRRRILRKMFPNKFKGLRVNTNLNNRNYLSQKKYMQW